LRIIGGRYKGRKLSNVRDVGIRPTADRVREALFNILGAFPVEAVVADLFAGTGALGLEALSRGAVNAVFVDRAPQVLSVLEKNINLCGVRDQSKVIRWDIARNLNCLETFYQCFNLIFIDPPYGKHLVHRALNYLLACGCLASKAVLVVESDGREELAELPEGLICDDVRTYSRTKLWFLSYIGLID
jgi:16S rRNA (guanine966-N2)-methyltransferase